MTHNYDIKDNSKILLKQIILAICLFFSVINLVFLITTMIVHNWFGIVYAIIIWVILLIIRILSTFLTCEYTYKFESDSLVILKMYPMHNNKPIIIKYNEIVNINQYDNSAKIKSIRCCPKCCSKNQYMIKYQNEIYIIALDEYGYCLLNGSIK